MGLPDLHALLYWLRSGADPAVHFLEVTMYDIINEIIGHTWVSNYTGEQQYIMHTACALVPILVVAFIDTIKSVFGAFMRK